jgi:hypothetical protein
VGSSSLWLPPTIERHPNPPPSFRGRERAELAARAADHSLIIAIAMMTWLYATTPALAESCRTPEIAVSGHASFSRG